MNYLHSRVVKLNFFSQEEVFEMLQEYENKIYSFCANQLTKLLNEV